MRKEIKNYPKFEIDTDTGIIFMKEQQYERNGKPYTLKAKPVKTKTGYYGDEWTHLTQDIQQGDEVIEQRHKLSVHSIVLDNLQGEYLPSYKKYEHLPDVFGIMIIRKYHNDTTHEMLKEIYSIDDKQIQDIVDERSFNWIDSDGRFKQMICFSYLYFRYGSRTNKPSAVYDSKI